MDYFRKLAVGRLGELVGSAALPTDVQLRTHGAGPGGADHLAGSWTQISKGLLQAYANGVNSWLANNPLPPEYLGLELTKVDPWSPLDTVSYHEARSSSVPVFRPG